MKLSKVNPSTIVTRIKIDAGVKTQSSHSGRGRKGGKVRSKPYATTRSLSGMDEVCYNMAMKEIERNKRK